MTFTPTNTFTNGTLADATQVNTNFTQVANELNGTTSTGNKWSIVKQIYTSTAFNSTITGGGSDEHSYEMTAFTATNLIGKTYVRLRVLYKSKCALGSLTPAYAQFKIQEKYTGGAYADALAYNYVNYVSTANNHGTEDETMRVIEYLYTLNANDLANGCQFKLWSKSYNGAGSYEPTSYATFTNIQTIEEAF